MNFQFAEKINPFLEVLDFNKALEIAETELRKIPVSDFHAVLGNSLLHHTDEMVTWIDGFFKKTSEKLKIKALYFEMNEFDINTDDWYIYVMAYDKDGGLNLADMEWLCDYSREWASTDGMSLTGYETLQKAFKNEHSYYSLQDAMDWCEQIVIARFMELMRKTHVAAKERNLAWSKIPIYFTEHSYDFIVRSVNEG